MARIISYPTISTVASGDLIPISDTSDAGRPLYNVEVSTLSDFFNENGFWSPITGGINYSGGNVGIGVTTFTGYLDIQQTNVANDETRGANIDVTKENTSGAGFASNIYGIKSYGKGNSAETIVNIGGVWSKAEHTGSGQTYYITGGTNRGYHNGSGNSTTVTGTFSEARIDGTGVGAHQYVIGVNSIAKLDNANATVQYMQGQHCSLQLVDGEITDNATSLLLDFDYTGTGTVTGDFEYLRIQDDVLPAITGRARAINSLSTLPSVFAGSIRSSTFTIGSSAYLRDNGGDTELFSDGNLILSTSDGIDIEISDVIDISGAGEIQCGTSVIATSFVKAGGPSSQFLKADGSADSDIILVSPDGTEYRLVVANGGALSTVAV